MGSPECVTSIKKQNKKKSKQMCCIVLLHQLEMRCPISLFGSCRRIHADFNKAFGLPLLKYPALQKRSSDTQLKIFVLLCSHTQPMRKHPESLLLSRRDERLSSDLAATSPSETTGLICSPLQRVELGWFRTTKGKSNITHFQVLFCTFSTTHALPLLFMVVSNGNWCDTFTFDTIHAALVSLSPT